MAENRKAQTEPSTEFELDLSTGSDRGEQGCGGRGSRAPGERGRDVNRRLRLRRHRRHGQVLPERVLRLREVTQAGGSAQGHRFQRGHHSHRNTQVAYHHEE